jgi:hypothetical protein
VKRFFVIDNFIKEAPACLKETPALGSTVLYNDIIYKVEMAQYSFVTKSIFIDLIKI